MSSTPLSSRAEEPHLANKTPFYTPYSSRDNAFAFSSSPWVL
jgi:hypothetical protein